MKNAPISHNNNGSNVKPNVAPETKPKRKLHESNSSPDNIRLRQKKAATSPNAEEFSDSSELSRDEETFVYDEDSFYKQDGVKNVN